MRSKLFLLIVMSATSCSRVDWKERETEENESEKKYEEYNSEKKRVIEDIQIKET